MTALVALLAAAGISGPVANPSPSPELECKVEAISTPNPRYPFAAQRKGIEGEVEFMFLVAHDGTVRDVRITKSPDIDLAYATIGTVRSWTFKPHTCGATNGAWMKANTGFRLDAQLKPLEKDSKQG